MAESYPIALPTGGIRNIELFAQNAVAMSVSPFTYSQQVYRHQGQSWGANITLPPMLRENAEVWIGFLLRLRGQRGTFLLGDPIGATPRGSAATTPGTPVVNGAGQTGDFLNIDGLPLSTNGYLKAGDYIQLGTGSTARLHKVLEDVNTDGTGAATLNLFPGVRVAPNNGATVTVANCVGNFRLASNETNWSISEASSYGITFSATEAI